MATETSNQREKQEQSIKARKHELFVDDTLDTGPRKTFKEYLRETPAAPLSKNVKLMLWGSAAPVILLFLGALLTVKGAAPKPPKETVLPPSPVRPIAIAQQSEVKHPPAPAAKPTKPEDKAKSGKSPEQKPKPPKKPKNPKSTDKPASTGEKVAATDKTTKDEKEKVTKDAKKTTNPESSNQAAKGKDDSKNKPDAKSSKDGGSTPSPTPDKPKRAPLFKKKKPPVFTYPKREGEKKEEKGDSDKEKTSTTPDAGSSSP